jgi:hypothetical protein
MPGQLPSSPRHTISISVFVDPSKPATLVVSGIPWYPGITVLQAMVLADAMTEPAFSFRAVYASFYGAFIDQIIGTADADIHYWMLSVDADSAQVGTSTQLIVEDPKPTNVDVEWKYTAATTPGTQPQVARKIKAIDLISPR